MHQPGLIAAILLYIAIQFVIVLIVSHRNKSEADYLLAGRNLSFGLVMVSLFATWFGSETVMGSSGAVAAEGLSGGRIDPFGYTITLLIMAFLLAKAMREKGYVTFSDFFRDRYGATAEKISALVMIPTSIIWAAAQLLAFGHIFALLTGLPFETALLCGTVVVILYTSIGGMLGDVWTDFIQGFFIIIGLLCMLFAVVMAHGGVTEAIAVITPDRLQLFRSDESLIAQLDTWCIPILGSLVAQEAMGRMLSARTPKIAKSACFSAAGLYFCVGLIPVLIGLMGYSLIAQPKDSDTFLTILAKELLPWPLYVLLLGALISAILSTINSALLSVTAMAGHNLLRPLLPQLAEKKILAIEKLMVIIAGIAALYIASSGESIFGLVEMASSFGSAGILTCVLLGLWLKGPGQIAALVTLATGVALTIIFNQIEIEGAYLYSVLGCVSVFLVSALWHAKRSSDSSTDFALS